MMCLDWILVIAWSKSSLSLRAMHAGSLLSCAGRLFSADVSGCMHLWSVESGQPLPTVSLLSSQQSQGGVFSASFDSKLELVSFQLVSCLQLNHAECVIVMQGVVGTDRGSVHFLNWTDCTSVSLVNGHSSTITALDITQDNTLLASATEDGSLAVWRLDTLEQTVLFQATKKACNCVAFGPTNNQGQGQNPPFVVAGYSDGTLRIFDLNSLKISVKLKPHSESVQAVAFSVHGKNIVCWTSVLD